MKLVVAAVILIASHAAADPFASDHGVTASVDVGVGGAATVVHDTADRTRRGVTGGIDLDVAGWIGPRLAVGGRLGAGVMPAPAAGGSDLALFLGPAAQVWPVERLWLGGAIGWEILGGGEYNPETVVPVISGLAGNLRAGVVIHEDAGLAYSVILDYRRAGFDRAFPSQVANHDPVDGAAQSISIAIGVQRR